MKQLITLFIFFLCLAQFQRANANSQDGDTVIIELNSKSKIIVYTIDRTALKDLQKYDLNKMIKDLNAALGSSKIQKIELEDENGSKYLKDTTLIFGDENGAKTRIKIGNMELFVDADDWSDLEDEFDDDIKITRSTTEEESIDRTRHFFNLDLGVNNWVENGIFPDESNKAYAVKPWGSWYFAMNSVNRSWLTGPLFMDWGLGVSWYNWKMQDPNQLIAKGDEHVELQLAPTNYTSLKSKLTAPYINVTMVPMLDFAKGRRKVKNLERGSFSFKSYKNQGIRFGVGGYAGYRIGGKTKYEYEDGGKGQKDETTGNFYLTNFRYGVRAQMGYKGLDLFAQYDLNNVFAPNRGPAGSPGLNALSFGIIL